MKVYQIKFKVYLLKNIVSKNVYSEISSFIDLTLMKNEEFSKLHIQNSFKNYTFNSFYPIEQDQLYKEGNIYTITLRTINEKLADYFNEKLSYEFNNNIKGLTSEINIIHKKHIERIYSITPVILKTESGYWKSCTTIDKFEKNLKENLIKKYNHYTKEKIDENFQLYNSLKFENRKPIAINYKNIILLGDKITLNISENHMAQELAYMSLGTGILEMNSRGMGYCNYKWL